MDMSEAPRARRAPAFKDKGGGPREAEEAFAAGCNARVVKGAETYYRNMFFRCHRHAARWPPCICN